MQLAATLGRLHPALVHLPIGLFAGILVLEISRLFPRNRESLRPGISVLWVTCCLATVVTAYCGWQLAVEGGYQAKLLFLHRWLSVGFVAAVCLLTALHFAGPRPWARTLYGNLLVATSLLLLVSGHQGGTLTHGRSYLTKHFTSAKAQPVAEPATADAQPSRPAALSTPPPATNSAASTSAAEAAPMAAPTSAPPAASGAADIKYAQHVQPIFNRSCVSCHGSEKMKGELRLDSPAAVVRGSENGGVFVPGKPLESPLYLLVSLPEDDPDVMPQKGDPLSAGERKIIHDWILQGADFGFEVKVAGGPAKGPAKAFSEPEAVPLQRDLQTVVRELESAGVIVRTFPGPAGWLSLNFSHCSGKKPLPLAEAAALSSRTAEIVLARTAVDDPDLEQLGRFHHLVRLSLRETGISDDGLLHLRSLTTLRDLNLAGTPVTDAGVTQLSPLTSLKNLYVWGTAVTPQGMQKIQERLTGCRVTGEVLDAEERHRL